MRRQWQRLFFLASACGSATPQLRGCSNSAPSAPPPPPIDDGASASAQNPPTFFLFRRPGGASNNATASSIWSCAECSFDNFGNERWCYECGVAKVATSDGDATSPADQQPDPPPRSGRALPSSAPLPEDERLRQDVRGQPAKGKPRYGGGSNGGSYGGGGGARSAMRAPPSPQQSTLAAPCDARPRGGPVGHGAQPQATAVGTAAAHVSAPRPQGPVSPPAPAATPPPTTPPPPPPPPKKRPIVIKITKVERK